MSKCLSLGGSKFLITPSVIGMKLNSSFTDSRKILGWKIKSVRGLWRVSESSSVLLTT